MIDSTLTPTVAEPPGIVSLQSSHVVVAPQHVVWAISRIWQVGDGAMPSPWAGFAILFPWNLWQKGPTFLCLFSWHWSKCTHTFGFTLGFSSRGILLPNTSLFLHAALVEICRRCWHWARLSSCYQDSHWHWMPRLGPTIRWFEKSSHSRPQQATVWKGFSSVICVAFRLNSHEAFSSFSFGISQGLRPTLGFLCRSTNCRMGSEHLELLELSVFSAR